MKTRQYTDIFITILNEMKHRQYKFIICFSSLDKTDKQLLTHTCTSKYKNKLLSFISNLTINISNVSTFPTQHNYSGTHAGIPTTGLGKKQ